MDRVKGKAAIVTGGASGIGRAAAKLLAKEGATVAVTDITDAAGRQVVEEIKKDGGTADFWHMDVAAEKDVERVFGEINEKYGKINILVNNAGIAGSQLPTHELPTEEWHRVIDIDLNGVFYCTKHVIAHMRNAGGGSIVNMSSMLGIIGGSDPVYHAAKGAVRLLTKGDASVYARDKIRVNSVHPGLIMTPGFRAMGEKRRAQGSSENLIQEDAAASMVPLGRTGQPEDIANSILFLASDDSSYMTGSELVIDGGIIMT